MVGREPVHAAGGIRNVPGGGNIRDQPEIMGSEGISGRNRCRQKTGSSPLAEGQKESKAERAVRKGPAAVGAVAQSTGKGRKWAAMQVRRASPVRVFYTFRGKTIRLGLQSKPQLYCHKAQNQTQSKPEFLREVE